MVGILNIFLCIIGIVLLVPVSVLLLQVLSAVLLRPQKQAPLIMRPRLAVLVPAHNESRGIVATLDSIFLQLNPGDRCLVVADNCTDDTAAIAARSGAEVVERFDAELRGKGYALNFGVRHLADVPPEVLIVVDADCVLKPLALEYLACSSMRAGRPVQALYLMQTRELVDPMRSIAEFAWVVKNLVRPLGFHRLGLPCQLMGTGMAFPWPMISSASLASGQIVEDMKLGIDLAKAGTPPLFCPEAEVISHFPASVEGAQSQRIRWEHGHLGMIFSEVPKMIAIGLLRGNKLLLALALDLSVPPLALLALLLGAMFVACFFYFAIAGVWMPFAIAWVLTIIFGLAIMVSWFRFGRSIVRLGYLLHAFWYALSKLPVYVKFLVGRQVEWVRSKRDAE